MTIETTYGLITLSLLIACVIIALRFAHKNNTRADQEAKRKERLAMLLNDQDIHRRVLDGIIEAYTKKVEQDRKEFYRKLYEPTTHKTTKTITKKSNPKSTNRTHKKISRDR